METKVKVTNSPWIQFTALLFAAFVAIEAMVFQAPAIPAIAQHFKVPAHLSGLIIISFYVMSAALYPISGRLADRYGRKRILLIGLAIFAVSEFAAALSPSFSFLLVCRALQGVAVSAVFPVVISYIGVLFPPEQRGKASGIFNAAQGIASTTGAVIAGFLIKIYGWPIIYWVSGWLAVIGFVVTIFFVKETKGDASRSMNPVGVILIFIMTGCFLSVSTLVGNFGITSPYTLGTIGGGIIAAILLWINENRVKNPTIELSLLKERLFTLVAIIYLGYVAAMQVFIYAMNFFLSSRPGGDVSEAGMFFMYQYGAAVIAGLIIGYLADKINNKRLLIAAFVPPIAALVLFSFIDAETSFAYISILSMLFGLGAAAPLLIKLALEVIPAQRYGAGNGLLSFIRDFGAPLGSVTGIVLYSTFSSKFTQSSLVNQATDAGVDPNLIGDVEQAAQTGGEQISQGLLDNLQSLGVKFEDLFSQAVSEGITSALHNIFYVVIGLYVVLIILSFFIPTKRAKTKAELEKETSA